MAQPIRQLGDAPFARAAMLESLSEFLALYARRPIRDNHGGMGAPHLFATWFMVRALRPTHIVESGVFKGLGTWLLEAAAPDAELFCIDPKPAQRRYRSARARYFTRDFSQLDWDLPGATTLLFFDDHQNAFERVQLAARLDVEHLIFDDNYPIGRGDCYTLKQAFMGKPAPAPTGLVARARYELARFGGASPSARETLERLLATYFEFPPPCIAETTRWGDRWEDERYPTPEPLLAAPRHALEELFAREAGTYTWICYARLRRVAEAVARRR
jgi:hypothetical protein